MPEKVAYSFDALIVEIPAILDADALEGAVDIRDGFDCERIEADTCRRESNGDKKTCRHPAGG